MWGALIGPTAYAKITELCQNPLAGIEVMWGRGTRHQEPTPMPTRQNPLAGIEVMWGQDYGQQEKELL